MSDLFMLFALISTFFRSLYYPPKRKSNIS
jgi:hypothetical protein